MTGVQTCALPISHIATIKAQIEKFDKDISAVGKQETWTKVSVHKVDLGMFEDSEEGMQSLKTELETFNEGLDLASIPRYLTHPDIFIFFILFILHGSLRLKA